MVIEKFPTGIEGLDQLTGGGFLRGSAYILQGPPGAGKTLLANQFCYFHVRSGGRALYMTLLAESSSRMLGYVSQMDFFDHSAVPGAMQYISGYGVLEREGLPGLLKLVQHELKRHRATVMVLDGTFVAQSLASEQQFRAFIHGLQGVAGVTDAVIVMLTHQNRKAGSPEHTMCDGWIELQDETRALQAYRTIQVRKHRGAANIPGKHRFRIAREGVLVFPQVESLPEVTERGLAADILPTERVSIGQPGIDRMLCSGLPAGSATLVLGPTGSGKTTLGMHFLSRSCEEEPGLMLGFYETPGRLLGKARNIGLDLDTPAQAGHLQVLWRPPAGMIVDEIVGHLIREAKRRRAKRILVEGLPVIRDSLINPARLPYVINALTTALAATGSSVVYTAEIPQLGLHDTLLPEHEISAMVSNVLLLNAGHRGGAFQRQVSVVKLRDSDFDPCTRAFHITDRGIELGHDPRTAASGNPD